MTEETGVSDRWLEVKGRVTCGSGTVTDGGCTIAHGALSARPGFDADQHRDADRTVGAAQNTMLFVSAFGQGGCGQADSDYQLTGQLWSNRRLLESIELVLRTVVNKWHSWPLKTRNQENGGCGGGGGDCNFGVCGATRFHLPKRTPIFRHFPPVSPFPPTFSLLPNGAKLELPTPPLRSTNEKCIFWVLDLEFPIFLPKMQTKSYFPTLPPIFHFFPIS